MPAPNILPRSFYERDTVAVARDLLGCTLVSTAEGMTTSGRIVETEAYLGADDPGSHAATKGVTRRNAVMYGPAGRAYVYFTYGSHHMFNVVTEIEGTAGAVLVRALEPMEGLETMAARRATARRAPVPGSHSGLSAVGLANGPGKLTAALGIDLACNGAPLDGSATLFILRPPATDRAIGASGRIGLSSGHEMELRFYLEGNRYVSRARPGRRPPTRSRAREGSGR
jgi:DNA-3-methyladenine glycosylase